MYKNLYKYLKSKKENNDLFKSVGKKSHPIHNKQPHFIFSAENPYHTAKLNMNHNDVIDFLKYKGYQVEEINGKYGSEEKSIMVHNPPKHAFKYLKQLSADLGQDSSIISNGYDNEMHYHHGENAGKHHKGQGSVIYKQPPEDFYSTLEDGTHFSHNFDFDTLHSSRDSMYPEKPSKLQKSENAKYRPILCKNEGDKHPLNNPHPNIKLIHYSPKEGLESIDPEYHGTRGIGAEAKQGRPEHPMSFHYLEGVEPESTVTSSSKHKYISSLGNKKLYDVGKDNEGIGKQAYEKALEEAENRQINRGIVRPDEHRTLYHQMLKDAGYHGIYNSTLDSTMSHAVGLFHSIQPDSSHMLHPNDFKKTSAEDHHATDEEKEKAKQFADENGHHDYKFLHGLNSSLKEGEND